MKMNGNNRWSSQRSIYDYPEHLNPFYEEENHKRIRFWKIGSDKSNRSNSFSLDGLKGLWSFKTFKLRKRTSSSTLGINKTSESPNNSPPMLRRGDNRYGSQATIDENNRNTVDNHFHRGAHCRSSLQDLDTMSRGGNFFNRNGRFRSTMQEIPTNSSIRTPTLVLRSRYTKPSISKGSSQLSVNSNPFDDENDSAGQIGSPDRISIRRTGRKKRKAPLPPIISNKSEIDDNYDKQNDTINITNLTAEIESFVKNMDITFEQSEAKSEDLSIEKIQNLGETEFESNEKSDANPVKIFVRAPTDEESEVEFKTLECTPSLPEESVPCEVAQCHSETKTLEDIKTPNNSSMEFKLENVSNRDEFLSELKITESNDDLTTIKPNTCFAKAYDGKMSTVNKFDEQTLELDSMEFREKKMEKKPNTPSQRRRSVKEIIESINKCQSLLKINQKFESNIGQEDSFHFSQLSNTNCNTECQRTAEINNNTINDNSNKVEWNPVPKPRRHRHSVQGSMNKSL